MAVIASCQLTKVELHEACASVCCNVFYQKLSERVEAILLSSLLLKLARCDEAVLVWSCVLVKCEPVTTFLLVLNPNYLEVTHKFTLWSERSIHPNPWKTKLSSFKPEFMFVSCSVNLSILQNLHYSTPPTLCFDFKNIRFSKQDFVHGNSRCSIWMVHEQRHVDSSCVAVI